MIETTTLGCPPRLTAGLRELERVSLEDHLRIHGPMWTYPLAELTALTLRVDLRGRGGAGFPFAAKLGAVAAAARRGGPPVVVVNAAEGEPASLKDKLLMTRVPHLVLDGALLAAQTLAATQVVVGVTDAGAEWSTRRAAQERRGSRYPVRVVRLPDHFVTGESGALIRGVNGETPIPPSPKVHAAVSGVRGRPTLASNAETFAQLAVLARLGPHRFAEVGTPAEPGTVLATVTAGVGHRVVIEVAFGTPLPAALRAAGAFPGQGVLVGGYHGCWLTPRQAVAARLSRASMAAVGGTLGAGVVAPLADDVCPLGETARVAAYLGASSAGQCGPCRRGLPDLAGAYAALAEGRGEVDVLRRRAGDVRGACNHPRGMARFVTSAVEAFADDVEVHLRQGSCGRPVRRLLPVPGDSPAPARPATGGDPVALEVDWGRCAGHGLCAEILPELIELDEWGYPKLIAAGIPPRLRQRVAAAVAACPSLALRVRSPQRRAARAGAPARALPARPTTREVRRPEAGGR